MQPISHRLDLDQPLQNEESMQTLSDEIKTFIVKSLAHFDTPSEVVEAVKANFDVEISRQHVYTYDPRCTQPPAPRWRELHAATRAAFLRDADEIGISHRTVRLRMLDRMAHRAEARHYMSLAAHLLEQGAKESERLEDARKHSEPRLVDASLPVPERPAASFNAPAER
jgi:hypothetical protein